MSVTTVIVLNIKGFLTTLEYSELLSNAHLYISMQFDQHGVINFYF